MIRNLFGGSKCRTIDVCDIFGDGSGKALYRLDGNANDESGNYHGTETAITYGGGVYERGLGFTATTSNIATSYNLTTYANSWSVSMWFKNGAVTASYYNMLSSKDVSIYFSTGSAFIMLFNGGTREQTRITINSTSSASELAKFTDNQWHNIVVVHTGGSTNLSYYIDGVLGSVAKIDGLNGDWTRPANTALGYYATTYYGDTLANTDQVRIFNRAITATEVATLYAECAPTSTVDNINPFEDGSLKALYQFNGDATDKTGVYNGTATNVTYGTGKFGQCAVFNGSSAYVALGDNNVFSPLVNNISVGGWVKFTSTSVMALVGKGVASNYEYMLGVNNTKVALYLYQLSGTSHITDITGVGNAINDNNWHHILFTLDYLKRVAVYVDGTLVASTTTFSGTMGNGAASLDIGRRTDGLYYFNGSIDQLRIFNKALTPMEVASLYNETTPLEEPMHSLVDPFKDGSGKALYRLDGNALDESGNYNGTATSVTYGAGRFGRCAIQPVNSSISSSLSGTFSQLSFSFWLKHDTADLRNYIFFVTSGMQIQVASSVGVSFLFYDGVNTLANSSISTSILGDNNWHHYVVTWGKTINSGIPILYFDGTVSGLSSSLARTTDLTLTNTKVFDKTTGGTTSYLDQIRFFNRALTASEVQTLYTEL